MMVVPSTSTRPQGISHFFLWLPRASHGLHKDMLAQFQLNSGAATIASRVVFAVFMQETFQILESFCGLLQCFFTGVHTNWT